MKKVLAVLAAALLSFVALTAWALESGSVATLSTRTPEGTVRETHVWYVVRDGELWVEAGAPENSWFLDVQREPLLEFHADELSGHYRARLDPDPAAAPRLRSELRSKYGLRDLWVGMLVDSSRSRAVQLHPIQP